MRRTTVLLLLLSIPCGAFADLVVYDVNLSGLGDFSGELMGVTGTITADTVTSQLTASDLVLTFGSEPNAPLPSLPNVVGDLSSFQWVATLTELRFERTVPDGTGSGNGFVQWSVFDLFVEAGFTLGAGDNDHVLLYENFDTGASDSLSLLGSGPAESPGFLVGVASIAATPEPSAALFGGLLTVGLVAKQRRRAAAD